MNYNFLNQVNLPEDLKLLNNKHLNILCKEIRDKIINTISQNGGHIASSLGVVELTVAIHKVFNCPKDKLIWDVGHQSYAHKLLTGRKNKFDTIRQDGGLLGFPRQSESEYDAFIAGHSSTSISAACGIAKANEILNNNDNYTIAVIGDGSLTGGLAYEGLNNVRRNGREKLIVILNDNKMSISENVGAIAKYLSKIRSAGYYFKFKDNLKKCIFKFPLLGPKLGQAVITSKAIVKESIYHSNVFENLGFEYLGPVDGHDLNILCSVLERAKQLNKPVFIHIKTIKGKGYKIAEKNPCKYHGVTNKSTDKKNATSFSDIFGDEITKIAAKEKKLVVITAAMKNGTGLGNFSVQFPKRFFDVGIAEQHAVTFASGLASNGCIPVFAVYSSFLQRGFDQIIHDAAIENQHIILAVDRAGIVGEDGETHQGIFDVSFLSMIPNVTIFSPFNYYELRKYLNLAICQCKGVVAIRYPRGEEFNVRQQYIIDHERTYHVWNEDQSDTLLITYGRIFALACNFRDLLKEENKNVSILKLDKIWPLETEIVNIAAGFKKIIFIEESIKNGGIAEHFGIMLIEHGYNGKYVIKAIDNQFVNQATVMQSFEKLGFSISGINKIWEKLQTLN